MTTSHTHSNFHGLARLLILGPMVVCCGILGGIVPDLAAQQSSQIFRSAARADEFNDKDLRNYAATLMQMEPIRKSVLAQVSKTIGDGKLPNLMCSQPDTMSGLNGEAKSLFVNYCNQFESIATSRGLSTERFNEITQALRSNSQLKSRVLNFMN